MNNLISVITNGAQGRYGITECYGKVKEWGFDAVDATISSLLSGSDIWHHNIPDIMVEGGKDFIEMFRPWKEGAEKYGIINHQAHAPFPCLVWTEGQDTNARMIEVLKNYIRASDFIGCRNLVVHPFFMHYAKTLDAKTEWDLNIESYMKLAPVAKEYGVHICLENMFTVNKNKIYAAICSDFGEAARYIDTLNSLAGEKLFGFCFDTGHALVCGSEIKNAMLQLGDRISLFHIHDNNGWQDQHIAPYMGNLDWDRFMEGLNEIHYKGVLSFETDAVWNVVNPKVMDQMMKFIAACGRMFAEAIK